MLNQLPVAGITMGDPAGIGPEIAVKALTHPEIYELCRPVVIGDARVMRQAKKIVGAGLVIRAIRDISEISGECGVIDVLDLQNVDADLLQPGKVSAMAGRAAFECVKTAIALAMEGKVDATVTGPINKEAINLAGFHFAGHTDIYAHYTHTREYAMLLAYDDFRVIHVSTHVSLREACDRVKRERVLSVIRLADEACRKFGVKEPKIGVAGLNPHAGEGGLFGWEEECEIRPAVEEARNLGIRAEGPVPPDTLYSKAYGGWYDIAVAMYHDQGHIPLKVVGFRWNREKNEWDTVNGVNITLGLPIIRTSVDHGTAFEIAGTGKASDESMVTAIRYAAQLAAPKTNA